MMIFQKTTLLTTLLMTTFCAKAMAAECTKITDLTPDSDECSLNDLPDAELQRQCDVLGLDVKSVLLDMAEGDDDFTDGSSETLLEDLKAGTYELTHDDYVKTAYICMRIEEDLAKMIEEDPDQLLQMEQEMMQEDPEMMVQVITDVLTQSPELMDELVADLLQEDPDLMLELTEQLEEGERLQDRPDVMAGLVAFMLRSNDDFMDELDKVYAGDEEEEGDATNGGDEL
uniref:Uncharacterized protein n=1 Tax=Leptocylindrus danicus TaxID=163516 RepID=A0A6U2LJD7_9STRA